MDGIADRLLLMQNKFRMCVQNFILSLKLYLHENHLSTSIFHILMVIYFDIIILLLETRRFR